jgi:hypothetical protein
MDPLLLQALSFGTAFLAGGLVAVVSGIVTFRYAQKLQRERDERAARIIRRALVAEIRENIRRLGGVEQGLAMPLVPLVRTAWDQARGLLMLSQEAFDAIAAGHQAATYAHEVTVVVIDGLNRSYSLLEKWKVPALTNKNVETAKSQSWVARESFVRALVELGEVPEPTTPSASRPEMTLRRSPP